MHEAHCLSILEDAESRMRHKCFAICSCNMIQSNSPSYSHDTAYSCSALRMMSWPLFSQASVVHSTARRLKFVLATSFRLTILMY